MRGKMGGVIISIIICLLFVSPIAADEREKKGEPTILEEITVIGDRDVKPVTPVNTRYGTQLNIVTDEQIKEQNNYDFQTTLRNVPGVMFRSWNLLGTQTSHSLYIRGRGGSHPSADFTIQFDGAPRYGALFGQVLGDSIPISAIGSISIYKSPQPSEFSSGYAAINVLPKYLKEDGQELVFDMSGGSYHTFSQSISGGVKKGQYDFYASQSWVSTEGHSEHSRAQQQNYYVNMGYQLSKAWNVRFLANYVNSQTAAPMPNPLPSTTNKVEWPRAERYDTETKFATLTINNNYDLMNGYIKAYWNETNFDLVQELTNGIRFGGNSGGVGSRQEVSLYGVRAKEKLNLWAGSEIMVGADLDFSELKNTQRTYSGQAVPGIIGGLAKRVWGFPDTSIFSPYIAVSQMFGKEDAFYMIPSAGLRYYSHNEFKNKLSNQVGLVLGYAQTLLSANYSKGVNYPSPIVVMNMVRTDAPVANPSQYWRQIKPEVVDHYEIGLTHTWRKIASVSATAFYDKGRDRFQAYMFGAIPTFFNDPIGRYKIQGVELTCKANPFKNLEIFTGATWLDAKATGNNRLESDRLPYTPKFQLQAGATWNFSDNFRLYVDLQHMQNLYQGTVWRSGTLNFTPPSELDKLDDITLLNARLSYKFKSKQLLPSDSEVFIAVNNLFNKHYEYAKGYKMPGTTLFAGLSAKIW